MRSWGNPLLICICLAAICIIYGIRNSPSTTHDDIKQMIRVVQSLNSALLNEKVNSPRFGSFLYRTQQSDSGDNGLGLLGMIKAFLPNANLKRALEFAAHSSSPYSAVTVCRTFQGYIGHPKQVHYNLSQLGGAISSENEIIIYAGLFGCIKDEKSFELQIVSDVAIRRVPMMVERNMNAALAEWLAERSEPYMCSEWARIAEFTDNDIVRNIALNEIGNGCQSVVSEAFSDFVKMIREAALKYSAKRFSCSRNHPSTLILGTNGTLLVELLTFSSGPMEFRMHIRDANTEMRFSIGKNEVFEFDVDSNPYLLFIDRTTMFFGLRMNAAGWVCPKWMRAQLP